MKDIISFDVKLTPSQKLAQDKLNQVHQLYDEIEKLLGTQDVFKRPHLFMALPKKEPQTNEEWLRSCNKEQLAGFLSKVGELDEAPIPCGDLMECSKNCGLYSQCAGDDVMPTNEEIWLEWLKQHHNDVE